MRREGNWDLSPAYDLCHTYNPSNPWVSHHALSVNGKRSEITGADFLAVADTMGIKRAGTITGQINEIVQSWDRFAKETEVERKLKNAIGQSLIRL